VLRTSRGDVVGHRGAAPDVGGQLGEQVRRPGPARAAHQQHPAAVSQQQLGHGEADGAGKADDADLLGVDVAAQLGQHGVHQGVRGIGGQRVAAGDRHVHLAPGGDTTAADDGRGTAEPDQLGAVGGELTHLVDDQPRRAAVPAEQVLRRVREVAHLAGAPAGRRGDRAEDGHRHVPADRGPPGPLGEQAGHQCGRPDLVALAPVDRVGDESEPHAIIPPAMASVRRVSSSRCHPSVARMLSPSPSLLCPNATV
jgi:hypothetical protein